MHIRLHLKSTFHGGLLQQRLTLIIKRLFISVTSVLDADFNGVQLSLIVISKTFVSNNVCSN